jgi:hypothetical protein
MNTMREISNQERIMEKLLLNGMEYCMTRLGLSDEDKKKKPRDIEWQMKRLLQGELKDALMSELRIQEDIDAEAMLRRDDPEPDSGFGFVTGGSDFKCPHCQTGHDIEWNTEYGDPCHGDYVIQCVNDKGCNRTFHISVSTRYESRP